MPQPTEQETQSVVRRLEVLHERLTEERAYYRAHVVWLAIDLLKRFAKAKEKRGEE